MTVLTEGRHPGAHLVSDNDANGHLSREQVIVAAGASLEPGTVLGKVSAATAPTSAAKSGGNTGNGTMSAVTTKSGAKAGVYKVEFTAATKFDVMDPEGFKVKSGSTGTAYSDDLGFTITAGATPFVAGDGFDITVPAQGQFKFKALDLAASDGAEVAAGILYGHARAASADTRAVANVRDTVVIEGELVWPNGITVQQKANALAQLAKHHIIAR